MNASQGTNGGAWLAPLSVGSVHDDLNCRPELLEVIEIFFSSKLHASNHVTASSRIKIGFQAENRRMFSASVIVAALRVTLRPRGLVSTFSARSAAAATLSPPPALRSVSFFSSAAAAAPSTAPAESSESSKAASPAAHSPAADDALVLTPRALRRLSDLRARARAEGRPSAEGLKLRVRVDGGGCSGFKYEFLMDDAAPAADDASFGRDGCVAVVDAVSLGFLRGATVDWEESLMRSAFIVASNPNAEAACGCKSSFAVKAAPA